MTPQERQLVAELFERLSTLENAPRDADAERVIAEGLTRAPHAVYALVQSVLVQDEALKRADGRIRELEAALESAQGGPSGGGGFLDSMRESVFGRSESGQGSVPSVRPGATTARAPSGAPMGVPPGFRNETTQAPAAMPAAPESRGRQGGSFLGTAAAAAAGVIGGALLLDGIKSMMGQKQSGLGALDSAQASDARSPWGASSSDSSLAREAGLSDVGRGDAARSASADSNSGYGMLDEDQGNAEDDELDADDGDGFDIGDGDIV
jgi:hypothetical protein